MFDDLTEPLLSMVALTLVVCLLFVVAMAAIGRDRDGIRVGLVFAAVFAVVCILAQIEEVLGWVMLGLFLAALFGGYTHSQGSSFLMWAGVSAFCGAALAMLIKAIFGDWIGLPVLLGPLLALGVYRFAIWLRGRGSTYGARDLAPA